jgi:Flp pilus assembly protein TadG
MSTTNPTLRTANRRKGAALLETALALLVLIPLTLGMIEFSYFFFAKHSIQGAAREGARAAILPDATNSKVTTAVQNAMTMAGLNNSGYTVTLSPSNVASAAAGTQISVTVQCNWSTLWTVPVGVWSPKPSGGKVTGVTVMRKEG